MRGLKVGKGFRITRGCVFRGLRKFRSTVWFPGEAVLVLMAREATRCTMSTRESVTHNETDPETKQLKIVEVQQLVGPERQDSWGARED